jgi:PhnB protein
MLTLTPYLLFDGSCRQAMQFYQSCLGGELTLMTVKDSPASTRMPAAFQDKIINARLRGAGLDISASDWLRPDRARVCGNTACLYLSGGTLHEIEGLFERLSNGAEVTDPLSEQFFGAYGALNDRFGVRWMLHTDQKSQEHAA